MNKILLVGFILLALMLAGCGRDKAAITAEYESWSDSYQAQYVQTRQVNMQYIELLQNQQSYSEDALLEHLSSITTNYAEVYENYNAKSDAYKEYLRANKEDLNSESISRNYVGGLDVEAMIRNIVEHDVELKQNLERMKGTLQQALATKQAKQQLLQSALSAILAVM
jgi:hypothetical protein